MSDEMNNMNDIHKTEDQLADQAFSEEIRRKLAEPGSGKPTLEEFKLMVYKDREKRRKKRSAMVACIVIACLAGFFAFDQLVPEVGADKNPKEEIVTEDGVIIEDGGWGSSTGEDDVCIVTDWRMLRAIKEHYPQIIILKYTPKQYEFKKLTIKELQTEAKTFEYIFANKNESIIIETHISEKRLNTFEVSGYTKTIESSKGTIYINDVANKTATIQIDDGIVVNIWCDIDDNEIIKLVNGMEY